MNGLVLIDKPKGCTSHDVVNRWRRLARTKRAGHLGTLDPMATGLLLIVTGNATRLARFFEKQTKTYEAEIQFGMVSDTYDAEGDVKRTQLSPPEAARVLAALDKFRGSFLQTPPPVSAKKINGVPAYKLARTHQPFELAPVQVEITAMTVREFCGDKLSLTVTSPCRRRLRRRLLGQHLRARVKAGHGLWRQKAALAAVLLHRGRPEQDGFGPAMKEASR